MPKKKKPHSWAHERAEHIRKKNPGLPKGAEYGIAQLQEVAVGKEKEHGGKVKPSTKTKAKKKYKKPKSEYEKKPKGSGRSKKSMSDKQLFKEALSKAVSYYEENDLEVLSKSLYTVGKVVLGEDSEEEHDNTCSRGCCCETDCNDKNGNGICDDCGIVYGDQCQCGEESLTAYCLGCENRHPVVRVVFSEDGQMTKSAGFGMAAATGAVGALAGMATEKIVDTVTGGGNDGAISTASTKRDSIVAMAEMLENSSNTFAEANMEEEEMHADRLLNALLVIASDDSGCCPNYADKNGNGICDTCGCVNLEKCSCGEEKFVARCNGCSSGTLMKRMSQSELVKKFFGDKNKGGTKVAFAPAAAAVGKAVLTGVGSAIGGAIMGDDSGSQQE